MKINDELFDKVLAEQQAKRERSPQRDTYRTRVEQAYDILIEKAKAQETVYYGELMNEIGTGRGYIGPVLGGVSRLELRQGRPPLSALVIQKDSDTPGEGFCEELLCDFDRWEPGEDRRATWERELESVYQEWSTEGERAEA